MLKSRKTSTFILKTLSSSINYVKLKDKYYIDKLNEAYINNKLCAI